MLLYIILIGVVGIPSILISGHYTTRMAEKVGYMPLLGLFIVEIAFIFFFLSSVGLIIAALLIGQFIYLTVPIRKYLAGKRFVKLSRLNLRTGDRMHLIGEGECSYISSNGENVVVWLFKTDEKKEAPIHLLYPEEFVVDGQVRVPDNILLRGI